MVIVVAFIIGSVLWWLSRPKELCSPASRNPSDRTISHTESTSLVAPPDADIPSNRNSAPHQLPDNETDWLSSTARIASNPAESPESRLAACVSLAEHGGRVAVADLLHVLMTEPDGLVTYKLAPSLQAVTNRDVVGLLFEALTNEQVNASLVLALADAVPRLATPDVAQRVVEACHTLPESDSRRGWLLQVVNNLRGDDVSEECARLIASETNADIQAALAWSLVRNGSTNSVSSVIATIENMGTTNLNDQLVKMLSKATDGENLEFMVGVFDSTTNSAVKWAIGTAISKMRGFNQLTK